MQARQQLAALHPRYVRLLVDWAALQPLSSEPPALEAPVDGCARGLPPCGAYPGLAGELAAVASEQRAARAERRPEPEVVLDLLGAPAWAALPAHGCERPGTTSTARPVSQDALAAYSGLVGSLLALGRREGVGPMWLSPWNEPNDPRFLSPQRETCSASGAPAAVAVYAQLARAMAAEVRASGGGDRMLLGELGGYDSGSPHRLSIAEFVAALPADVLCLSGTWAVHAYAAWGADAAEADPVAALEAALDVRGGCAAGARVWVTESGAGAADPGRAVAIGPGAEAAGCSALATQLAEWGRDPRVGAVFQYTFRSDPVFPVGLVSADLGRTSKTYGLWSRLAQGGLSAASPALCAS